MTRPDNDQMWQAVYTLLEGMGLDPSKEEGLNETPRRVRDYLLEFAQPFDPQEILKDGFEAPSTNPGIVCQSDIPFRMICEHHLLPAVGYAHVGYLPHERVIGLSKLPRLVHAVGHERPSLQETIGERIASILNNYVQPKGVIVVIQAEHTCMACRGAKTAGVNTMTSIVKGIFRDVPHARDEFYRLIEMGRK